jgi:hypothetical protein
MNDKSMNQNILLKLRGANFFGQESKGLKQLRGNGNLMLTNHELYFKQWLKKKEILIPISNIQTVETVTSHLHKSVGRPLLKVTFLNELGKMDSMAWWVRDVNKWITAINDLKRKSETTHKGY